MNDLCILGGGSVAVKWAGLGTPPSTTSKDADSYGAHKLLVFHAYVGKNMPKIIMKMVNLAGPSP
jgi:hypothetical protein